MARRNKILVPEARQGLDDLKAKIANTNHPDSAKYEIANEQGVALNKGYNGNIQAKDAGKVGGQMGGNMVKELVRMGQQQIRKQHQS